MLQLLGFDGVLVVPQQAVVGRVKCFVHSGAKATSPEADSCLLCCVVHSRWVRCVIELCAQIIDVVFPRMVPSKSAAEATPKRCGAVFFGAPSSRRPSAGVLRRAPLLLAVRELELAGRARGQLHLSERYGRAHGAPRRHQLRGVRRCGGERDANSSSGWRIRF